TFTILRQFSTDDRLLVVTDSRSTIPDYFAGRLPADDPAAATAAVRKLLGYETAAPLGENRNATLLLADDDVQGDQCDNLEWTHLRQTDDLNRHHLPPHEDRDYV